MALIEDIYQHYLKATGVTTDSRQLKENNIFFALKGDNFDGNTYASQALEKGADLVIIDNKQYDTGPESILVEDSLKTLQELALHHRKQLNIPFIGLTGTNGKTTTKELIHKILSKKFRSYATAGNFNNHIGVPLTILGIKDDAEIAVIEMGANHIEEIALLCRIADPGYGIITNIGKAHLEGFGGYEGVIRAKTELYEHLQKVKGTALVNIDDPLLMDLSSGLSRVTYGKDINADVTAEIACSVPFLEIDRNGQMIKTQLYGDYNFENIMAAICIGKVFEVDPNDIADAISGYTPSNSRSQLLRSSNNLIYLDAYNANPSSMLAAIRNFHQQEAEKKVLILGDMLELGRVSQEEHKNIIEEVKGSFDMVILVGPEFAAAGDIPEFEVFTDTKEAAVWLKDNPISHAHILVKGSRGIALEDLLALI